MKVERKTSSSRNAFTDIPPLLTPVGLLLLLLFTGKLKHSIGRFKIPPPFPLPPDPLLSIQKTTNQMHFNQIVKF